MSGTSIFGSSTLKFGAPATDEKTAFSFGTAVTTTAAAPTKGFSFAPITTSTGPTTTQFFGSPIGPATTAAPLFNFSAKTQGTASVSESSAMTETITELAAPRTLSFASAVASASVAPLFGSITATAAPVASTASTTFTFGSVITTTSNSSFSAAPFSFNTGEASSVPTTTRSQSSFSFGGLAVAATTDASKPVGFSFGNSSITSSTATSTTNFAVVTTASVPATTSSLSALSIFGTQAVAATTDASKPVGFSFGNASATSLTAPSTTNLAFVSTASVPTTTTSLVSSSIFGSQGGNIFGAAATNKPIPVFGASSISVVSTASIPFQSTPTTSFPAAGAFSGSMISTTLASAPGGTSFNKQPALVTKSGFFGFAAPTTSSSLLTASSAVTTTQPVLVPSSLPVFGSNVTSSRPTTTSSSFLPPSTSAAALSSFGLAGAPKSGFCFNVQGTQSTGFSAPICASTASSICQVPTTTSTLSTVLAPAVSVTLSGSAIISAKPLFGVSTATVSTVEVSPTATTATPPSSRQPTAKLGGVSVSFGAPSATVLSAATAPTTSVNAPISSILTAAKYAPSSIPSLASSALGEMSSMSKTATTTTSSTASSGLMVLSTPAAATLDTTKPIQFGQLDQLLNRITLDVETQERLFMNQVLELNAYDRVLRSNQQKIFAVSEDIKNLEEEKDHFIHTVDFLAQQQTELEAMVVDLEKSLGLGDWTEMTPIGLPDQSMATQADNQRQTMLRLQTHVDAQLKQVGDDISELIDQVAELQSARPIDDNQASTVDQIAQILKRQMDSLSWVDQQTEELKQRVAKLSAELLSV